jgi:hypothetical protein
MVPSEGNMSLKNPVTPPGIDSETVRVVVQRLNHYATPAPYYNYIIVKQRIHSYVLQHAVKLWEPQNNQQNFKSFNYWVRMYKTDLFIY